MKPVYCSICHKMAGTGSPDVQMLCVVVHSSCLTGTMGERAREIAPWLFEPTVRAPKENL